MVNQLDPVDSNRQGWRLAEAYVAEVELERDRWAEISAIVAVLHPNELRAPGYYRDPPWSVQDLMVHFRAWMAEARVQLLAIASRTYVAHEVDIDARNAKTLASGKNESWQNVWRSTNAGRAWMLEAWFSLREPVDAADVWVRKAGAEHYGEHLSRLREWATYLIDLRTRPKVDERDP
jgi:hypothetical protein